MKSSLEELQQQHARPVFILEPEPKQEENVATFIKAIEGRPWCTAVTAEHGEIRVRASDIIEGGLRTPVPGLRIRDSTGRVSARQAEPRGYFSTSRR